MEVAHIVCFERHRAEKHSIKANTKTPDVWGKPFVTATIWLASKQYLRGYIGRSTALLCHNIVFRVGQKLANTKIAKLKGDIAMPIF